MEQEMLLHHVHKTNVNEDARSNLMQRVVSSTKIAISRVTFSGRSFLYRRKSVGL